MATGPTTVPSGLTVQQWDAKYYKDYVNANWFKQFEGTGANKMIQVKEDLTTKPGDTVTYTLINRLTGEALGENDVGEGNEEEANLRSYTLRIREYFKPVKFKKFEAQKTAIDLREGVKSVLMDWNMELDRDNVIRALGSINGVAYADATETQKDAWLTDNADRVLFGNAKGNTEADFDHSDSLAAVTSSMKLTSSAVSLMKRMAKTANPKIRPIRAKPGISKSDMYILFAPSEMVRDIANDDSAFQQANRDARNRGTDNPLFSGADYIWDNIAIYEIEDIESLGAVGDGGTIIRPCYLCGAQALGKAWAKRPETVEEMFDYKRVQGIGIKQWYEIDKLRFGTGTSDTDDLKDHGVVTGYFAAAADA